MALFGMLCSKFLVLSTPAELRPEPCLVAATREQQSGSCSSPQPADLLPDGSFTGRALARVALVGGRPAAATDTDGWMQSTKVLYSSCLQPDPRRIAGNQSVPGTSGRPDF